MKTILIILIVVLLLGGGIFAYATAKQNLPNDYYNKYESTKIVESTYRVMGKSEVEHKEVKANKHLKKYVIFYPKELETDYQSYPVVVMVNGVLESAKRFKPIFKHLASWGFIVIGNEDGNTASGDSAIQTLLYIIEENSNPKSVFYKKVDLSKIGIAGHGEGGIGAINAVTSKQGHHLKSLFTLSTTSENIAYDLHWNYDVSGVKIPYFLVASVGVEDEIIKPLSELQAHYNDISDSVFKVMARRVDADHDDMVVVADAYMTAWFRYTLMGDKGAAKAFIGEEPEIEYNPNWQDVQINKDAK